ncbi:MAG: hypothetical protein J1F35_02580 [Erysipelotrichales bacterium]|nr:hypothetical protein [Erysipelotrichales bacterium]
MKTPLRYQFTGHDCGVATMENAISYMLPREAYPPELLHFINNYLLDGYTKRGWGFFGTSHEAMNFFASWLSEYFNQRKNFKMSVDFHTNEEVTLDLIKRTFEENSDKRICAVVYCYDYWGHYVLVTGFTDEGDVKIFDCYYRDEVADNETEYTIVNDAPTEYNRIIPAENFSSDKPEINFALGPWEEREVLFLIRDKVKKSDD